MTKCMLRYDLVITFVIGKKDNLTTAVNLNKEIQRVIAGGGTKQPFQVQPKDDGETRDELNLNELNLCGGDFTQWGNFTSFSSVTKIETPRGFLVLKAPTRPAKASMPLS